MVAHLFVHVMVQVWTTCDYWYVRAKRTRQFSTVRHNSRSGKRSVRIEAKSARGDGAPQSFDSRPTRLIIKNGDCWKMAAAPGRPWIIAVITIWNNFQPVIAMLSGGVDDARYSHAEHASTTENCNCFISVYPMLRLNLKKKHLIFQK